METYKPIIGYENYLVSNYGNVVRDGRPISKHMHRQGYIKYRLYKNGVQRSFYAHRLVALAFIAGVPGKEYVNHIDGMKSNNHVSNLEWCTVSENQRHAYDKIGKNMPKGANHHRASAVICLNTGKKYLTINEAVVELGVSHANVVKVCKGERSHTKGFQFKYEI